MTGEKLVATNRRARFDFLIEESYEAGIVLTGSEVKSLREGHASLNEAFARVEGDEVWLENLHIPPYMPGDRRNHDSRRPRKLLLHRREIQRLIGKTAERGLTLVPIRLYFKRGMAKVEVGLGKGKAKYEKRQSLREKEHNREIERSFGSRRGPAG
ncbi:MAG: SsrA-binding protein SmpB [Actinobacteria bacterium]|nr:SsrA-binding protein SmpB [Actinomycetota bacterium]